uniref:Uncharacterized protein n=1 Tax=Arundo donax TaxID=35708 RepID=A0A0A9HMH8_ARUDO
MRKLVEARRIKKLVHNLTRCKLIYRLQFVVSRCLFPIT